MNRFIIAVAVLGVLRMSAYAQCCGHAQHQQHNQHQEHSSHQAAAEAAVNIPAEFRGQLSGAVSVYVELRDALAKDDGKLAAEKTAAFKTALDSVNAGLLPDSLEADWEEHLTQLNKSSGELSATTSLAGQRMAFLNLSNALISAVHHYGPLTTTVYVQHCPMAFDNKGGHWLSSSEEILNPYFGKTMPRCGTVTKTVTGKQ